MTTLWKVLTRRKVLGPDLGNETPLARVLNTFDLTALGVGSTLGVGVYVLAGQVARNTAGPAVIISFLIAAIASVFAGLCYAEFGARTPKAGSAYIYSYVCVGEFIAFVIGWNLILEYIIGSASVAKGLSSYIDNLCNGSLSNTFEQLAPLNVPYLSRYFDIFAFSVPIILSIALAFGMKESSLLNNIFTTCNIGVVLFVIIAGALNAHLSNWSIKPDEVKNITNTTVIGHGGFFPFGIQGVIKGAATCFYGFVGFDCIATTGEEVKNPKRAIPIAIITSLLIIFLAYFGTSTVLTLMVPYYEQDPSAPIPFAFQEIHWYTAAYIVTFGAIFGLYASLFGAMFPLPRILYAMASDGLIFKFLGKVNQRFKTPVIGTLLAGLFTGAMAGIFALDSLVNMMSIGTLLAYTIVAACVLLLRYSVDEDGYMPIPGSSDAQEDRYVEEHHHTEPINASEETNLTDTTEENISVMKQIFNFGRIKFPNKISQTIVSVDICFFSILCLLLGLCSLHLRHEIASGEPISVTTVTVILILMALSMLSISSQPVSRTTLSFQVPWVPLIPALSIFCNIYLMVMLDIATWIRFVVWMIIGIPTFYFTRRHLSNQSGTNDIPSQGYINNGFYEDNLVYSKADELNRDDPIIIEDKMIAPLKIVRNSNDQIVQTPSPSIVLESLDLVIDSYADHYAIPFVASASDTHPASVLSNKPLNGDFRDTPNRALRTVLLNSLKSDITSENAIHDSEDDHEVKSASLHEEIPEVEELNKDTLINTTETENESRNSSSSSEISYVSAASFIDTGQEGTAQIKSSADNYQVSSPPPPPPPPMENLMNFTLKKVYSDIENTHTPIGEPKHSVKTIGKDREFPMLINKNSLNSVKLRHVHRPSMDRAHSQDDITSKQSLRSTDEPNTEQKAKKDSDASSSTNLMYSKKPDMIKKDDIANTNPRENVSQISKPGRYLKSKSVSELEMKNNMKKDENTSNTLKRMELSKDALNSVKLKPVVRSPLNRNQEVKSDLPDSLKFGTLEFEEFKDKLSKKLREPVKILREPSFLDSKSAPKKPEIRISRDDVIQDHLDLPKARVTMENEVEKKLKYLNNISTLDSNQYSEAEQSADDLGEDKTVGMNDNEM